MVETLDPNTFADELRPAVEKYYDRHLESPRSWAVYEEIDWGQGESFKAQPWSSEDYAQKYGPSDDYVLDESVRSAVFVNLLTEDNAPYYTNLIMSRTPEDHPLQVWNRRWTREEGQHSDAIRDWVHITRVIDPALLEDGRRVQMDGGEVPQPKALPDMLAYVPFQEEATRVAHLNTMRHLPKTDKIGHSILSLVAGDEGGHYRFYRDVAGAALEIDPSTMLTAIYPQVRHFDMPGTGIPEYKEHAARIANAGVYNLAHFREKVVMPTLKTWEIDKIPDVDLTDEAKVARDNIFARVEKLGKMAARFGHTA